MNARLARLTALMTLLFLLGGCNLFGGDEEDHFNALKKEMNDRLDIIEERLK